MVEWLSTYLCSKCNATKKVLTVIEEDVDTKSGNPYRIIKMDCGHEQKTFRVSKEIRFLWNIRKGETVRVEPIISDGEPSVAVSGNNYSIVGGAVNIGLEGAKDNKITVNVTHIKAEGSSKIVQSIAETDINITYNEIIKEIDRTVNKSDEIQEVKNILEEIKDDLNSKQIPYTSLEKLKKFGKIYTLALPWVMKGIDLVIKYGSFNI